MDDDEAYARSMSEGRRDSTVVHSERVQGQRVLTGASSNYFIAPYGLACGARNFPGSEHSHTPRSPFGPAPSRALVFLSSVSSIVFGRHIDVQALCREQDAAHGQAGCQPRLRSSTQLRIRVEI